MHCSHQSCRRRIVDAPEARHYGTAATCGKSARQTQKFIRTFSRMESRFAARKDDYGWGRVEFVHIAHREPTVC